MPGTVAEGPTVSLSCERIDVIGNPTLTSLVANNFWGKEDAGVQPLLERMQNAKGTCDELKAFYNSMLSCTDKNYHGPLTCKVVPRSRTSTRENY